MEVHSLLTRSSMYDTSQRLDYILFSHKKNKILSPVIMWLKLVIIKLSKFIYIQKDTYIWHDFAPAPVETRKLISKTLKVGGWIPEPE